MAGLDGYIGGNATSGIGQGLAFVLPEGKAGEYQMHLAQQHAAQLQAAAQYKREQQQKLEEQYHKEFLEQKLPDAMGGYNKLIADEHNKWLQDAADYKVKNGRDPFVDPDFIKRHNEKVMQPAAKSNEYGKSLAELRTKIDANPSDYSDEAKQQVSDAFTRFTNGDVTLFDKPLPILQQRPYTENDFVASVKEPAHIKNSNGTWKIDVPDSARNRRISYDTIFSDPKYNGVLKKRGINPGLAGFGEYAAPNGNPVFPTNDTDVNRLVDGYMQRKNDPNIQSYFNALNIPLDDEFAAEKLKDAIKHQNPLKATLVTDLGRRLDSRVTPNREREYSADNNDLAHARYGLSQAEFAWQKSKGTQGDKPTQYQDMAERLRRFATGSEEPSDISANQELGKMFENNPAYLNGVTYDIKDPKHFKITIPAKYKTDPTKTEYVDDNDKSKGVKPNSDRVKIQDAHTYTFDSTNPTEFHSGLAAMVHNLTGDPNAKPAKALTSGGKNKVQGGIQSPTIKHTHTEEPTTTKIIIKGSNKRLW